MHTSTTQHLNYLLRHPRHGRLAGSVGSLEYRYPA